MGFRDLFRRTTPTPRIVSAFPLRPAQTESSDWRQTPTIATGGERSIVGEARHQDYLEELACGRNDRGCVVQYIVAELVREPDNPYDADAVRVDVGGREVGYIPRDETLDFHDAIASFWSRGELATCRATLVGGWNRSGDRGHIGVSLDVDDELREQLGPTPLVPFGPRVTVTCEEHYSQALATMLGDNQRRTLPVVLLTERESNPHKPKQSGPAIAVQIEGSDVGYLTPAMTKRYLPFLRHLDGQGVALTCGGSLKRSEKQIEVRLEMAQPESLGFSAVSE